MILRSRLSLHLKEPCNVHSEVTEIALLKRCLYRWLGFKTLEIWDLFSWIAQKASVSSLWLIQAVWTFQAEERKQWAGSLMTELPVLPLQKVFRKTLFMMFCWSKLSSVTGQKQERKCWLWDAVPAKSFQPPREAYFGRMLRDAFWVAFHWGRLMGKMLLPRH